MKRKLLAAILGLSPLSIHMFASVGFADEKLFTINKLWTFSTTPENYMNPGDIVKAYIEIENRSSSPILDKVAELHVDADSKDDVHVLAGEDSVLITEIKPHNKIVLNSFGFEIDKNTTCGKKISFHVSTNGEKQPFTVEVGKYIPVYIYEDFRNARNGVMEFDIEDPKAVMDIAGLSIYTGSPHTATITAPDGKKYQVRSRTWAEDAEHATFSFSHDQVIKGHWRVETNVTSLHLVSFGFVGNKWECH